MKIWKRTLAIVLTLIIMECVLPLREESFAFNAQEANTVFQEKTVLSENDTGEKAMDESTDDFKIYYLVSDQRDDEGNWIPEYLVDENGNCVTEEEVERIRADEENDECVCTATALPSTYDLRDYGYVTPVKNQAGAESCWAFAAISALESSMIKQGYGTATNTDFSEAHLAWFGQRQRTTNANDLTYGDGKSIANPFSEGANWYDSTATLMRGSGSDLEKNARWIETRDEEEMMQMSQPESRRYARNANILRIEHVADDPDTALEESKTLLMTNGNLWMAYYSCDDGYNKTNHCFFQNKETGCNHAVAVVGWDDNYSRYNFNSAMRPTQNGAWLVKGSWGTNTSVADKGYYWLSYEDESIRQIVSLVAGSPDLYENIYQYDGSKTPVNFSIKDSIETANRFIAKRNELLTHVAFFSPNQKPVQAQIDIYVGYDKPVGNDPTEGMYHVTEATTVVSDVKHGYRTVQLKQPVPIIKDLSNDYTAFTIKLTFKDPDGGTIRAAFEGPGDENFTYGSQPGQSFMRGSQWLDMYEYKNKNYHNAPIKGMTQTISNIVNYSYDLIYDANGGSGAPTKTFTLGPDYVSSTIPIRSGYKFIGWAKTIDALSPEYMPGDAILLSGNTTLYAVWSRSVNAPFWGDLNGDHYVDYQDSELMMDIRTYSLTPSNEQSCFGDVNMDGKINGQDALLIKRYRTGIDDSFPCEASADYQLNPPTKTTYTKGESFERSGLSLIIQNKNDTSIRYSFSDEISVTGFNATTAGQQALQAEFRGRTWTFYITVTATNYTLSYDANGGSSPPISQTGAKTYTISSTSPNRICYNFIGWSKNSNATSAAYLPGDSITLTTDTTLYAVWRQTNLLSRSSVSVPITYNGQVYYYRFVPSASGRYVIYSVGNKDTKVYLLDASGNEIYNNDDGGEGNNFRLAQTLTAGTVYYYGVKYFSESQIGTISMQMGPVYSVAYDANGGSDEPSLQEKDYGTSLPLTSATPSTEKSYTITYNVNASDATIPETSKAVGCTFSNWNTQPDGSGTNYNAGASYTTDANVMLYAQWLKPTAGALATPTRDGYTFDGWYTLASGGTRITNSSTIISNMILYAHWTANTYSVMLDGNGSTSTNHTTSVTATYGSAMPTLTTAPTKTGYTFAGYYDATSGGTQYYKADKSSARTWNKTAATTLYARWETESYTLSYDAKGGSGAPSAQTGSTNYTVSTVIPTPSAFGATFRGWYIVDSSGAYTYYYPGDAISLTSDTVLQASWSRSGFSNDSDSAIGGEINYPGKIVYQYHTQNTSGKYVFYSYGDENTEGYLYDTEGNVLVHDDDSGNGSNFRITYNLTAGTTYYVGFKYQDPSKTGHIICRFGPVYTVNYNPNGGSDQNNRTIMAKSTHFDTMFQNSVKQSA